MKIWIDQFNTAPEGYHWAKNVDCVIETMQNASLAIGRALRNGHTSTEDLRVKEINMSNEFASSRGCNVLDMYLEELGAKETLVIKTH